MYLPWIQMLSTYAIDKTQCISWFFSIIFSIRRCQSCICVCLQDLFLTHKTNKWATSLQNERHRVPASQMKNYFDNQKMYWNVNTSWQNVKASFLPLYFSLSSNYGVLPPTWSSPWTLLTLHFALALLEPLGKHPVEYLLLLIDLLPWN